MEEVKAIFHIDDLIKWKLILKNVSNLLNVIDVEKSNIEVLANSEAVIFYKSSNSAKSDIELMKKLNSKGIKFTACNNALKSYSIEKQDLIEFINVVPVGVLELINKQKEGYSYIKP